MMKMTGNRAGQQGAMKCRKRTRQENVSSHEMSFSQERKCMAIKQALTMINSIVCCVTQYNDDEVMKIDDDDDDNNK